MPAPEASADGTLVSRTGTSVTVTAAVGLSNTISVWQAGDTIRIRDTGDTVTALGGCRAVSANEAACPGAGSLTELVVHAGDQADDVTSFLESPGVTLVGGAGDDSLYGGGANDTLEGDEGADFLSGEVATTRSPAPAAVTGSSAAPATTRSRAGTAPTSSTRAPGTTW